MRLKFGAATDVGMVRQSNEDAYSAEGELFIVADGMGGHNAGEVASALAVTTMKSGARNGLTEPSQFRELVQQANTAIYTASLDDSAQSGMGTTVTALAVQSNGKIIVVGGFTTYNGNTVNRIARLNTDGRLDTTFNAASTVGFNSSVNAVALQADGKIIAGGAFTTYHNSAANYMVRLNADGSRDTTFNSACTSSTGFNGSVSALAIASNGKIVAGGAFATYNGSSSSKIAQLTVNGCLDSSFVLGTGFGNTVSAVGIDGNGKIIVGGVFTSYQTTTTGRIARLNADGSLDTSFNTGGGFSASVYALEVDATGKIMVGGQFSLYQSTNTEIGRAHV